NLKLAFSGKKLRGVFALVRTNRGDKDDQGLLIKKDDEYATSLSYDAEDLLDEDAGEVPPEDSEINPTHMVRPMLATKAASVFSKPDWMYELKWDGYRLLSNIINHNVNLYSRNGIVYNNKFPTLYDNLKSIPYDVILDGE